MSNGRDPNFDGSYETSRYAGRTLEEDIIAAGQGEITGELPGGGTYRQLDDRIDVWTPGSPGNYRHDFYNANEGKAGYREGERD